MNKNIFFYILIIITISFSKISYSSSIKYDTWCLPPKYQETETEKEMIYHLDSKNQPIFTHETWTHILKKNFPKKKQSFIKETPEVHRWRYIQDEYETTGSIQDLSNSIKVTIITKLLKSNSPKDS